MPNRLTDSLPRDRTPCARQVLATSPPQVRSRQQTSLAAAVELPIRPTSTQHYQSRGHSLEASEQRCGCMIAAADDDSPKATRETTNPPQRTHIRCVRGET